MPFFPRTEKKIIAESLQRLNQNTNITQLTPGGKARFFISTVAREQESQQALFDGNLLQAYIKYCEDRFLDFFGDMMNRPRVEASHAEALNNNLMFYVASGTFGDINADSQFTIPAGTPVYTKRFEGQIFTPGLTEQPVIGYTTISSVVALPSQSFVYAPVRADVEGSESSVPRNTLTQHDFSSYTLSADNLLKCTNRFAIDNGVDREDNAHYRYRLSNVFAAKNQAVKIAIRIAALSVPGVSDVVEIPYEQGPGTFSLYIKGITPTVSPDLITAVSRQVEQVASYGERPFILAPTPIGLEFVASVAWSPRASAAAIAQQYTAMRDAVENAINNLDIGDSLNLSGKELDEMSLIDIMLAQAPDALYIGRDKTNTFDEVYTHRQSPTGSGTIRSLVLGDVVEPLYNERLILETSTRYRGIQFVTIE